jgi:hypothetical protein
MWTLSLVIGGLVIMGCDNSPGARQKRKDERFLKGRVFAEVRVLENPRRLLLDKPNDPGFKFEIYRQSQARMLKAPFVLQMALRKPEIATVGLLKDQANPLEWLEQNIVVDFPATEFMRISMKSGQKEDAAKIVNAVVDAFLEEVSGMEIVHHQKRQRALEKALEEMNTSIKSKMAKFRRLAEELGTSQGMNSSDSTEQASLKFRELAVDELAREELARAKDQVQLEVLKAASRSQGESSDGTDSPASSDVKWLEASIEERAIRIAEWRRILGAELTAKRATAVPSLELKSLEREIEDSMAFLKPIRDELTRLDLEDGPEGRVTLFRKATAEDKP